MFVDVVQTDGAVALQVHGELDLATGDALRRAVDGVGLDPRADVEMDLSAVTFVDCAGLRAVLRSVCSARHRGQTLSVTDPSSCVRRLSTACGVSGALRSR